MTSISLFTGLGGRNWQCEAPSGGCVNCWCWRKEEGVKGRKVSRKEIGGRELGLLIFCLSKQQSVMEIHVFPCDYRRALLNLLSAIQALIKASLISFVCLLRYIWIIFVWSRYLSVPHARSAAVCWWKSRVLDLCLASTSLVSIQGIPTSILIVHLQVFLAQLGPAETTEELPRQENEIIPSFSQNRKEYYGIYWFYSSK